MSQKELHAQMTELHETLEQTTAVSLETKTLLTELAADIQPIIQNPASTNHASLATRLEGALAVFEADHPQLTNQLQTIINTLSNMGI